MKKTILALGIVLFATVSCSKEDDNTSKKNDSNEPIDEMIESTYLDTEEKVQDYLKNIYNGVGVYIDAQNKLDVIRLKNNNVEQITPTDSLVTIAWRYGYYCDERALNIINELDGRKNPFDATTYIKQAKAIRAFVMYNMAMEWGYVPIYNYNTTTYELFEKNYIYDLCLNLIDGYDVPSNSKYQPNYISSDATNVLKAEIYLAQGKKDEALKYIQTPPAYTCFGLTYTGDMVQLQSSTQLYDENYTHLLQDEAKGIDNSDIWFTYARMQHGDYGVFAALRRLNKVQELTGIDSHYNLLPIPSFLKEDNITDLQNTGY